MRGELGPVAGDLLAEEDGGELADVGGLGGAHVVNERGDRLRVLQQPPDLILRLPPGVVVRHLELDQQQLQRLCHGHDNAVSSLPLSTTTPPPLSLSLALLVMLFFVRKT